MLTKLTILNNTSIPISAKGLDAATLRGRAIADNFANVTTPGYRRIEVSFEDQLKNALEGLRSDPNHMRVGKPDLEHTMPIAYRSEDPTNPGEINNVDVDLEAAKLAETQIAFNFNIRMIRNQLENLTRAAKAP